MADIDKEAKKALRKRETRLLLMLGFVGLACLFYTKFYRPKAKKIDRLETKYEELILKAEGLENEKPHLEIVHQELAVLSKQRGELDARLKRLESHIPRSSHLDRFLHYLTLNEFSEGIQFQSIKPIVQKAGRVRSRQQESPNTKEQEEAATNLLQGYQIQHYELRFAGTFEKMVPYLYYLDHLSRYAAVTRMQLGVNRDKQGNHLVAECRFSILISDEPVIEADVSFEVDFDPVQKEWLSPFWVESAVVEEEEAAELSDDPPDIPVTGIISVGEENRAVVDKKIMKAGDNYGDSLIKSIEKDKLIIETGNKIYEIPVR